MKAVSRGSEGKDAALIPISTGDSIHCETLRTTTIKNISVTCNSIKQVSATKQHKKPFNILLK